MSRYRIVESVGSRIEAVHSYEDLEIHHPSKRGQEPGRVYATVEGHREEVLGRRGQSVRSHDGDLYVSKDFVLQDTGSGSSRVPVPAPVAGVIGRVDRDNGLVSIYDRPGGEMIAQIRHMDLRQSTLKAGDPVEYGQPLGLQGGFGGGNPHRYGTHVHIDFNEHRLDQFRKYIRDLDTGVLTPDRSPATRSANHAATADGVLRQGERGPEVKAMQESLAKLGYRDAQGREIGADGHFGARTEEALKAFQRDHGLKDDGIAGAKTLDALKTGDRQPLMSDAKHPGNAMYQQALEKLEQLGPQAGFKNQQEMRNAAATLAFEAKVSGLSQIDHVALGSNGQGLFAVQGRLDDPAHHRVYTDREAAVQQPVERRSQQWQQDAQQQQAQQSQSQQREPQRMSM